MRPLYRGSSERGMEGVRSMAIRRGPGVLHKLELTLRIIALVKRLFR